MPTLIPRTDGSCPRSILANMFDTRSGSQFDRWCCNAHQLAMKFNREPPQNQQWLVDTNPHLNDVHQWVPNEHSDPLLCFSRTCVNEHELWQDLGFDVDIFMLDSNAGAPVSGERELCPHSPRSSRHVQLWPKAPSQSEGDVLSLSLHGSKWRRFCRPRSWMQRALTTHQVQTFATAATMRRRLESNNSRVDSRTVRANPKEGPPERFLPILGAKIRDRGLGP